MLIWSTSCTMDSFEVLSAIQDVAEPVAISTISVHLYPQLFQKFSNALTKLERQVSSQGISSMNMTFFDWTAVFSDNPQVH